MPNKNIIAITIIFLLVFPHPYFTSKITNSYGHNSVLYSKAYFSSQVDIQSLFKEPQFYKQFQDAPRDEEFRVLVKLNDISNINFLLDYAKDIRRYNSYSGFGITITKENLWYLSHLNIITEVWNNSLISIPESMGEINFSFITKNNYAIISNYEGRSIVNFTEMIDATKLWELGFFGDNVVIAILDTGVAPNQPNLKKTLNGEDKIIAGWNFVDNSTNYNDDNGHGTAVASIIAGSGLGGQIKGVAPNAKLLIAKILDENGEGTVEDLIAAIDWAIENNADIINLSLGRVVYSLDMPEVQAVNSAVEEGVIVCVAAGNARGIEKFNYNDLYTILSPGIATQAITVGAIDSNKVLYEHSSAGPAAVNFNLTTNTYIYNSISIEKTWLKPDVVAPGVLINATGITDGDTEIVSGTSFATAVVSGACALLMQRFPELSGSTIKSGLLETAEKISVSATDPFNVSVTTKPHMFYQGAGLIKLDDASDYLTSPPNYSIWPNSLPMLNNYTFINLKKTFVFHMFLNGPLEFFYYTIGRAIEHIVHVSGLPPSPHIKQHDFTVTIDTRISYSASYRGYIEFHEKTTNDTIPITLTVKRAYGRVLLDSFVNTPEVKYSPYGSLSSFINYATMTGILPILPAEGSNHALHMLNLNDTEMIILANFDGGEQQHYSQETLEAIYDYMFPGGHYGGGTVVILPTKFSNLTSLNELLKPIGIHCTKEDTDYELLTITSSYILFSYPTKIYQLYIPNPINVTTSNSSVLSYYRRFAIASLRTDNGSQIIIANNLNMLLASPYIYSYEKNDYDANLHSFYMRDNYGLLRNIFYWSIPTDVNVKITSLHPELPEMEKVEIKITIYNSYKYMSGWDLYLSFEQGNYITPNIINTCSKFIDYKNGTYVFSFAPSEIGLKPGEYYIRLRSLVGTWPINTGAGNWGNTVYIRAKFSWGPILVEISIAVCVVYLYSLSRKPKSKPKKTEPTKK